MPAWYVTGGPEGSVGIASQTQEIPEGAIRTCCWCLTRNMPQVHTRGIVDEAKTLDVELLLGPPIGSGFYPLNQSVSRLEEARVNFLQLNQRLVCTLEVSEESR